MKKNNVIANFLFFILFIASIYVYYTNNDKIKETTTENNSLKIEFKSIKSENQSLREINGQLLETNSNVAQKINKLKININ